MDLEKEIFDDAEEALPDEFQHMTADDILRRNRLLDNEIRVLKDESQRITLDQQSMKEKVKENKEKIKLNNQLPYLVGNVVEILDIQPEEEDEEDGANIDLDSQRKGKCVVLKTSTRLESSWRHCQQEAALAGAPVLLSRNGRRKPCQTCCVHCCETCPHGNIAMADGRQTIFLPVVGLVDADSLKPGDLVGVNKDSYLILDTLPSEYDSRVKAMEVSKHVHARPSLQAVHLGWR